MIAAQPFVREMPRGRRALRAVAETLLPSSFLVARGPRSRRRVALTFDDGPSELTRAYLDLLERRGARGTFFVVGSECERNSDLVGEITERGHDVGGHGYTHQSFPELHGSGRLLEELTATARFLPASPGGRLWVRPPYGALSPSAIVTCVRAGLTIVLWSLDSEDWRTRNPRAVSARVSPQTVQPGSIVLLHEGQPWTLDALADIVPTLQRSGYELVTVRELVAA